MSLHGYRLAAVSPTSGQITSIDRMCDERRVDLADPTKLMSRRDISRGDSDSPHVGAR